MGAEFVPRLDEGAIALQAVRPPSVSLEESVAATTRIERVLLDAYPDEIDTIVSRTGRAEIATDPMGIEISDIYLILHPIEEWTRADSKVELVDTQTPDYIPVIRSTSHPNFPKRKKDKHKKKIKIQKPKNK